MDLEKINELPKIPMLRTPVFRDIVIAGTSVRIHKPRARQAAIVAQRLLESFGETLLRVFTSPDEDLEKVFSSDKDVRNAALMKALLVGGFFEKALDRLRALGHEIGEAHLYWYFEQVLPGNVEIDGHRFPTVEDLDVAEFCFTDLLQCLKVSVEIAIYPTSDDPGTDAGKSETKSETIKPQRKASEKKARREKKRAAGMNKGGQSVPMSAPSG